MDTNYILKREIGKGSYSKVYLAEDAKTHKKVAIKRLSKKTIDANDYLQKAFYKELDIMNKCKHYNSVELYKFLPSNNNYNIVMELCDTDLDTLLNQKQCFSPCQIRKILSELNNVFLIMVKDHIMHRDLKLKNILVKFLNANDKDNFTVKLSDFGFSKVVECDVTGTKLGTPMTMAPEVLKGQQYSNKADLWSLGVIIYQLLFKELPFKERNEKMILEKIMKGPPKKLPKDELLRDLLLKLLKVNADERISWMDYFNHPFFGSTRYRKTQKLDLGLPITRDYECYVGFDHATMSQVVIKQFTNEFVDKHVNEFNKEISHMKHFIGNDNALQYITHFREDDHTYIICDDISGIPLQNYIKTNPISEALLQRMNKEIFNKIIRVLGEKNIAFDILSTYNFIINSNRIILYDFGLCKHFLGDKIVSSYYIKGGENFTTSTVKSNIMNYGIALYKCYYMDGDINSQITDEKNIKIKVPKYKKMSKEFINLVSKCCTRNSVKRPSWSEVAKENFFHNYSVPSIPTQPILIDEERMQIILESLDARYSTVLSYFNNKDFSKPENFITEMSKILMMTLVELKALGKLFVYNKPTYSKEEEIALMKIFDDGSYEEISINCKLLSQDYQIFDKTNKELCGIISEYLKKFTKIQSQILSIISKIQKSVGRDLINMTSFDFVSCAAKTFISEKMYGYLFSLFDKGLEYFDKKEKDNALGEFKIAKIVIEYLLLIRMYSLKKQNDDVDEEVINNFFHDEAFACMNMLISMIKPMKNKEKYIFVSVIGGMFANYFKDGGKGLKEETDDVNESNMKGIIEFYPKIVKMIDECQ